MKSIIVSGAAGFLGRAVVHLFLERGYNVIALVHSEKSAAHLPVHPHMHIHTVDLSDEAMVLSRMDAIKAQHGKIYAGVLLAGGYSGGDLNETTMAQIRTMIGLNFETAYNVIKELFPHFIQNQEGKIVLIGAQAPLMPQKGQESIAYSLSKSLLFQLADLLNAMAKGTKVTASVVVPSIIDTEANREQMPDADYNNWVKPEHLAKILEFVCSDTADVLRGTVLKVYNNA